MTRRYPDWTTRLSAAIEARAATPFRYGSFDCSLAACDLILAICDCPDPGKPFRGRYKTARGAAGALTRYLRRTKGPGVDYPDGTLPEVAARRFADLGFARWKRPAYAQRGDVVVLLADIGAADPAWALGTVDLNGREIVAASHVGWQRLPLASAADAWGVS